MIDYNDKRSPLPGINPFFSASEMLTSTHLGENPFTIYEIRTKSIVNT